MIALSSLNNLTLYYYLAFAAIGYCLLLVLIEKSRFSKITKHTSPTIYTDGFTSKTANIPASKNLLLLWIVKAIHLTRRKRTRIPRCPRRRIIEEVFEVASATRSASRKTLEEQALMYELFEAKKKEHAQNVNVNKYFMKYGKSY